MKKLRPSGIDGRNQDKWNSIQVEANQSAFEIPHGSESEFIIERYWGNAKADGAKSFEYEVRHPRWKVYNIRNQDIAVDFGTVYGKEFDFLGLAKPDSVMLGRRVGGFDREKESY